MKLEALGQSVNEEIRRGSNPPQYVIWMAPSGAVIECPEGYDLESAGRAAKSVSEVHPARIIAVYQLVGTAVAPLPEGKFCAHAEPRDGEPSSA